MSFWQEWNNIGQQDTMVNLGISDTNLKIAISTQADSQQMRAISILTMIFLPATFIAVNISYFLCPLQFRRVFHLPELVLTFKQAVFSMSFFNWAPGEGQHLVSPYVWVYFVVTAVCTLVTMGLWIFYNRSRSLRSKARAGDLEDGPFCMTPIASQRPQ